MKNIRHYCTAILLLLICLYSVEMTFAQVNADGTIDLDEGMAQHILYDTGGFDEDGFELYLLADTADRTIIEEYLETTK